MTINKPIEMEQQIKYYYPSNGTEGEGFMYKFCDKCYKYNSCTILTGSLIGKQPKQWIWDDDTDMPICTSFNPNRPNIKKKDIKGQQVIF